MPLILLDRDGVINVDRPESVRSLQTFKFLPRVLDALRLLNQTGWPIVVVTNQAVVGRGGLSAAGLQEIHDFLLTEVRASGGRIDEILVCTDTYIEPHGRRKPAPGMLLEAMEKYRTPCHETVMVGDAARDIEAAYRAHVHAIVVRTGKGEETLSAWEDHWGDANICEDLFDAAVTLTQEDFFLNQNVCLQ
ncbi:MAG: HAD-IIIA family hydrolase [Alphaproteobacteria bacterium]|nr:HAD-IIIA family hydrolase [Alphaproteobacteria bacterium]